MNVMIANLLSVNLVASFLMAIVAAKFWLLPHLPSWSPRALLSPILLFHTSRHLGLMFLAPGAVLAGMPLEFALPSASGDALSAVLAAIALYFVRHESAFAKPAVWLFNIVGTLDFVMAIALSRGHQAASFFGPTYWIPAFFVPVLLVLHGVVFVYLLKHWPVRSNASLASL